MSNPVRFPRIFVLISVSVMLLAPALAVAGDVHPLFNVGSTTQAPFPSDFFTVLDHHQNTHLRVNMPFPNCTTNPSDCLDVTLLNQLDGFNTQPRLSIPFDGAIDPNSVNSSTVFLVRLGSLFDPDDGPHAVIGVNQVVWDPASLTAFAESDQHLEQHTSYLLVVTNGVTDSNGDPVEASKAFRQFHRDGDDRHDGDDHPGFYRELLERSLSEEVLEHLNIHHHHIVAASIFTTGSVTSTLQRIEEQIDREAPPQVNFTLGTHGERTVFPVSSVLGILYGQQTHTVGPLNTVPVPTPALQVFPGSVATIAFGKFTARNWETAGGFIPAVPTRAGVPAVQSTEDLFFDLFVPAGKPPAGGWPVAIFGHGFGDNKDDSPWAVASTLAHNGIATIAINAQGHGFGAGGTLTVIQGAGATVLPAGGRGVDQNGDGVIQSTEGLFATGAQSDLGNRDGLQETVADLMQVVRSIQGGIDVDGDGHSDLDANRIYYFGQSLGGIYGAVLLAADPDVRVGVPNVPGGSLTDIARLSPTFRPLLALFLVSRVPSLLNGGPGGFTDNVPLRNQPPFTNTTPGAIAIQTFLDYGNWLQQAADPVAWAPFIRDHPLPGHPVKSVIIQFARGDKTVPNPTATALIRSGELTDRTSFFRNDLAFAGDPTFPKNPHTFLTNIAGSPNVAAVAIGAQTQIGVFFASGGTLTIDPDGPGPLFEVPIGGALPEDLGFIP
ncbi:MAG TPA: Ig-like domain-containing protein [Candidatus Angelobacter sp.]